MNRSSPVKAAPTATWEPPALKASAAPDYATTIQAALERLTDENRTGMGRLFKALGVSDPKLGALPGFEA